jgi:hypothetical protein
MIHKEEASQEIVIDQEVISHLMHLLLNKRNQLIN